MLLSYTLLVGSAHCGVMWRGHCRRYEQLAGGMYSGVLKKDPTRALAGAFGAVQRELAQDAPSRSGGGESCECIQISHLNDTQASQTAGLPATKPPTGLYTQDQFDADYEKALRVINHWELYVAAFEKTFGRKLVVVDLFCGQGAGAYGIAQTGAIGLDVKAAQGANDGGPPLREQL